MKTSTSRIIIIAAFFFASCSNLRYLPEGEKLYTGATVKLESKDEIKGKGALESGARKILFPKPNTKFLGLRVRLYIHNIAGTPKKDKGFKHWLKNGIGEPPALLSTVHPSDVSKAIDTWLYNNGVFRTTTNYELIEQKKKAEVVYKSVIHPPYKFRTLFWPNENDSLNATIRKSSKETFLVPGKPYELQLMKKESGRIDAFLKNNGFYYFNSEFLVFKVDSTPGENMINVKVEVKKDIPASTKIPYSINDIFVTPEFRLTTDSISIVRDTILFDGIHFINDSSPDFKPAALARAVLFRKGDSYSRMLHERTVSQLTSLGTFKFISLRFKDTDSAYAGKLDANILLTPMMKKSVHAEVEMISKSNYFIGPSVTFGFTNRNTFRGAEMMTVNLRTSFETQINGQYEGQYSFEVGPEINLYVPRFILPFKSWHPKSAFVPKTKFTVGYDFITRINFFDMNAMKFVFGYKWRPNELVEHEIDPFDIYYSKISNQSQDFKELLSENPALEQSLEQQFIIGLGYSYTYNQQVIERKINQNYFNGRIDLAGNLASLAAAAINGKFPGPENPAEIAGEIYSQYIRGEVDFRHYRKLTSKTKLAGRFYVGAGWAYLNTITLPYSKQFFSGGVNSVRAFSTRTLGPGSYVPPDELAQNDYYQQGGDMCVEGNVELRFNMISLLKGAIFVDAGNTWLLRPNDALPGGLFQWDTFTDEIAIGTGFGFRVDVDFFVLRFDFAFPLRKPSLPQDDRWVIDEIDFGSGSWRDENLILNIGIGYPF